MKYIKINKFILSLFLIFTLPINAFSLNKDNNSILISQKNFIDENKMSIENKPFVIKELEKINQIHYMDFIDKKIPIYFHSETQFNTKYNFVKNIFVPNVDFFMLDIAQKITNSSNTKIAIVKKEIMVETFDIWINYEFEYNNKNYKINFNSSINKSLFFDNEIYMNINFSNNNKLEKFKYVFDNFYSFEIKDFFEYSIDFVLLDISQIYKSKFNNYFALDKCVPTNINHYKYSYQNIDHTVLTSISYLFLTAVQKFDLIYKGIKVYEPTNYDISFFENSLFNEIDIFKFDELYLINKFNIGKTIKGIGFTVNIDKNFILNNASIQLKLNSLNDDIYHKTVLEKIPKNFYLNIDFNKNYRLKITIDKMTKESKLPSNITINDIKIEFETPINNLNIQSIKIDSFDNSKGNLNIKINYKYKNLFDSWLDKFSIITITNFLSYQINDENEILEFIKTNYFNNNDINLNKLKSDLINHNSKWLVKANNLFISPLEFEINHKNNLLNINFYLKNKFNKIVDKVSLKINTTTLFENTNSSNNKKEKFNYSFLYVLIPIILIVIIFLIIIIYKRIKSKKINL